MIEKLAAVILGGLLLGIGINGFLVPHHLLDGGIIGIGLILHYYYELPTGLSMILLSIPLYVLAWFFEKKYFFYSIHGLLFSSFVIDLLEYLNQQFQLPVLPSAVIGGTLVGLGIGVMLRYETSTGGTDLLAQMMAKLISVNVGFLIFAIDGLVILSGLKIVGMEKFLYSFITILFVGLMTSLTVIGKTASD